MFSTDSKFALIIDIKFIYEEAILLSRFVFSDVSACKKESRFLKCATIILRNWIASIFFGQKQVCNLHFSAKNSVTCIGLTNRKKNRKRIGIAFAPLSSALVSPNLYDEISKHRDSVYAYPVIRFSFVSTYSFKGNTDEFSYENRILFNYFNFFIANSKPSRQAKIDMFVLTLICNDTFYCLKGLVSLVTNTKAKSKRKPNENYRDFFFLNRRRFLCNNEEKYFCVDVWKVSK